MSLKPVFALPVLAAGIGIATLVGWLRWIDDSPTEALGGAELFADTDGDTFLRDIDLDKGTISLDELNIQGASQVYAAPSNRLYIEFGVLLEVNLEGKIVGERGIAGPPYALTDDGDLAGVGPQGGPPLVWRTGDERHPIETELRPGVLAFTLDGTLLAADRDEAAIRSFELNGTETRLLGPPGDDRAAIQLEQALEPISAIAALRDGRIAFVANPGGGNQLYMLEDGTVKVFPTDPPVILDGVRRGYPWRIQHLAPGPDNTLIAVGVRDSGQPVITLIDPDSGATEILAELEGLDLSSYVDPTFATDPPASVAISATAVGDDLFFLADGQLWRLGDAFAKN